VLIDKGLRSEGANFKTDIEPWLGDRIGFALTSPGAGAGAGGATGHKGDGVAAIASKDDDRAQAFVDGRPNTEKRSYRGVDYRYDAKQDTAAAVVGHIAMGPGALAAALGTGGPRLGDSDNYKTAAALLGGAKPSVFIDTPAVVKLLGATVSDQAGFAAARPTLDAFGPAAAGVTPDGDTLRVKAAVAVP
jgi:hypothetical protein